MDFGVRKRERILWTVLLVAFLGIFLLVITVLQKNLTSAEKRAIELEGAKTAWAQSEAKLSSDITDLKAQLQKGDEFTKTLPTMNPPVIDELMRKGFKGGSNEIIADLLKHNELIPYKGVLGGTMAFFNDRVFVLSDKWVIAYFEDGHTGGQMLLRYSVENGNISWKVIDSYLMGE